MPKKKKKNSQNCIQNLFQVSYKFHSGFIKDDEKIWWKLLKNVDKFYKSWANFELHVIEIQANFIKHY